MIPTLTPLDLTESRAAVFGRSPMEQAIDRGDAILTLCRARQLERDGLDTSGSQAAIIPMLEKRK